MKKFDSIKSHSIVLLFGFLLLLGCEKDFLDVPTSQPTPEEALSNPQVAEELVNSVYNIFFGFNMMTFPWYGVTEIASDNSLKGSSPGDTGNYLKDLDEYTFTETSDCFRLLWENHYLGIARANQAILLLPEVEGLEEDYRNRLIGEAKFLRGLFYFRMVRLYGGVPIIDFIPDVDNQEDINRAFNRATTEETYAFIEKDLREAIEVLPLKSEYPVEDMGRATKGAARTLLAKVSMYQGKWQQTLDLTNTVIATGEYALEPNYGDVWLESHENGIESIFETQGRGEDPVLGIDKYYTTQGARGLGGWGWGFNVPSEDLVNAYETTDERMDGTIIFRGETLPDGRFVPNTVENPRYNQKAYVNINGTDRSVNVKILRYAGVLLMNAEAEFNLGKEGAAISQLNKIRTRANLGELSNVSGQALEMAIWKERRLEFAMEQDRMFDLRRQGRAAEVMTALGKPFEVPKHLLYPIPSEQIDQSGGLLEQNPGW